MLSIYLSKHFVGLDGHHQAWILRMKLDAELMITIRLQLQLSFCDSTKDLSNWAVARTFLWFNFAPRFIVSYWTPNPGIITVLLNANPFFSALDWSSSRRIHPSIHPLDTSSFVRWMNAFGYVYFLYFVLDVSFSQHGHSDDKLSQSLNIKWFHPFWMARCTWWLFNCFDHSYSEIHVERTLQLLHCTNSVANFRVE